MVLFIVQGETGCETFGIRKGAQGTLAWSLEWDAQWLVCDPTSGESSGEVDSVSIAADTATLPRGTYSAMLRVVAAEAVNSPGELSIVVHVIASLCVPDQYATIQAAVDAAQPGDEVLIADGIYTGVGNRDLNLHGKAITVRSSSAISGACVIDCQEYGGAGSYFATEKVVTRCCGG